MNYSRESVAATIDHAVLKPTATDRDVVAGARMCAERGVFSVCVRPCDVALASAELKGVATKVGMVVGFPHGANTTEVKVLEAEQGLENGAVELDMVMNIGRFLSGDFKRVEQDIAAVVAVAHAGEALLKVILETCYLTKEQIAEACRISESAGADFVKTSTGFGTTGATPEAVRIMLDTVGDRLQVKAAGGIRDWDTAVAYLEQGCTRLGVGATAAVLDGAIAEGEY